MTELSQAGLRIAFSGLDKKQSKRLFADLGAWDFGFLMTLTLPMHGRRVRHYQSREGNDYVLSVRDCLLEIARLYAARSISGMRTLAGEEDRLAWRDHTWTVKEFGQQLVAFLIIIIDHSVTTDAGHTPGMHHKALSAVLSGIAEQKGRLKKLSAP